MRLDVDLAACPRFEYYILFGLLNPLDRSVLNVPRHRLVNTLVATCHPQVPLCVCASLEDTNRLPQMRPAPPEGKQDKPAPPEGKQDKQAPGRAHERASLFTQADDDASNWCV